MMEPPAIALFRQAYNAISLHVTDAVAEVMPLNRPSFGNVMEQLDLNDGMRLTDLARGAGMAPQSIGELVDQLEDLGLVERRPDPDDRRVKRVWLTDDGRQGQRVAERVIRESEVRIAEVIGPDRLAQLKDDMRAIVEAFETEEPRG